MIGILLGAAVGISLCLVMSTWGSDRPRHQPRTDRLQLLMVRAGVTGLTPRQLRILTCTAALIAAFLAFLVSGVLALGVVALVAVAQTPSAVLKRRAQVRSEQLRQHWPDVIDDLASAVRAGRALPEALAGLSVRGPELLRPAFARFGEDHRITGSFDLCLDRLAEQLADPTADQVIETMRLARQVGGTDLGAVLRTLSAFLREDARTRAELEVRRSWGVNAARMALIAPWAVLALLAAGSNATVDAYNEPTGLAVLAIGAGVSLGAYRLMLAIGTLPEPVRTVRA